MQRKSPGGFIVNYSKESRQPPAPAEPLPLLSQLNLDGKFQYPKLRVHVAGVQAALFLGGVFPPPSGLALVLTGKDRARAGLATDGNESPLVQGIVRDAVRVDVGPNLLRAPV